MSADDALRSIVADLAAIKSSLRRLYIVWSVSGPTLESSSAIAAMAQEESGHARILGRLAGSATSNVDAAALVPLDEITSWPQLVGTVGPLELAMAALLDRLKSAEQPEFSRNLPKIAAEERYHAQFYVGWFGELAKNDNEAGRLFTANRIAAEERVTAWLSSLHEALVDAVGSEIGGDVTDAGPSADESSCVHCGADEIVVISAFGGSLMTSLMKCSSCGGQFEAVRYRTADL